MISLGGDDVTNDVLIHHGIKGQKWYQRRYQNEDGSLTEAGRKRYGVGPRRSISERIDNFRKKALAAKVERAVLRRKEAEEKQRKKDADNSDKLKAAQRKREIEEENLSSEKTKSAIRAEKIQSLKDSFKKLTSNYSNPEERQAKFERDATKKQQKLQKMELKNQKKALQEQRKIEKARVKAEILKIKEERARREQQAKEAEEQKRIANTTNSLHFDSAAELYANRSKLTDAQFNAAKARLEAETRVKQLAAEDAKAAAAAKAQKTAWIKSLGKGVKKTTTGAVKLAVEKPAVAAGVVAATRQITELAGWNSKTSDTIFDGILGVLGVAATTKAAYTPKKDKQKKKDDNE